MAGRLAPRLGVSLAAVVLAALAAEAGLRLVGFPPSELLPAAIRASYRLEPGGHFVYRGFLPGTFEDFANPVELNRLGFHDRDYPEKRASPGTWRMMVLGDSYVAALEVPIENNFAKLLETRLRAGDPFGRHAYEVIAFGQGNRSQEAELAWLREFGPRYRPDLVLLLFFCGNDVMENSPLLFARARRFGARYLREVVPRKEAMFRRLLVFPASRLNGLAAEALTTLYARNLFRFHRGLSEEDLTSPELGAYRTPLAPEWIDAFERTGAFLDRIHEEAGRQGARFVLASLSGPQVVGDVGFARAWRGTDAGLDYAQVDRWVAGWARRRDVPMIALGPLLAHAGRQRVFWRHDAHLSPSGHVVVADALYGFLAEHGAPASRTASAP